MNYKDTDIDNWPQSWSYSENDITYAKEIVELFRPFIAFLKDSTLSRKTINNHIDNLWVLGGFLIRQVEQYEEYKHKNPFHLIVMYIDYYDGPMISDLSEYQQEAFDRTCRKFYKYLARNGQR